MKNRGSTGYKLHLQRLKMTGQSAMRTMKYPLSTDSPSSPELIQAIKSDYEGLYGSLNLDTYHRNQSPHSLKDFWLDCLRCGAIICPTESKVLDALKALSGQVNVIDSKQQQLMQRTNTDFFQLIDFPLFKDEVILSSGFRKKKERLGFFLDNENSKAKAMEGEILQATVGQKTDQQDIYWLKNYGVDKSLYWPADNKLVVPIFLLPDLSLHQDQASPIELISRIEQYLSPRLDSYQEKQIINYLGLGNNASGLSAAFGKFLKLLRDGNLQQIEIIFDNMAPGLWSDKRELKRRLKFLATSAKALPEPSLVKNWADYRSDFGGKLQSWLSNGLRQDDIIRQHLFGIHSLDEDKKDKPGHLDRLNEIRDKIDASKSPFDASDYHELITEIKDIVEQMIQSLEAIESESVSKDERIVVDQLEDYRDQLGALRPQLNELHYKVYGDSDKDRADKKYQQLFRELPRIPSFLGDVKTSPDGIYDKYLDSLNRVKRGIQLFKDLDTLVTDVAKAHPEDQQPTPQKHQESVYRFLQSLLRLVQINGGKIAPITDQIIKQTLAVVGVNLDKHIEPSYYIFKPVQARRRGSLIELAPEVDLVNLIPKLLKQTGIDWQRYSSVKHLTDWLSFIEITKIRLGLISQTYDMANIYKRLNQPDLQKYFPKVPVIFNRYPQEKQTQNSSLNTVLQQAVCSEMRGTVAKMTTEKIINRWVVQPINSEQKLPVITDIEDSKQPRRKGQGYYIKYPATTETVAGELVTRSIFKDKAINDKVLKPVSKLNPADLIPIKSSKYQLQFLDNSLYSKKWSKFSVALSSYSFIWEETSKISWDDQTGCQLTTDQDSGRLFVSIPFKLTAPAYKYKLKDKRWSKFLGVDIGEYGVATYILNSQDFQVEPPTGFIYEPALRIIKKSIKDNKNKQKAGTFSIPSTYTKRLRDQAITSIRNQLHSIVVNARARPIYEWQVSGFESGSGKIAKIYHSVKRADTGVGSDADDMERSLVWGTKFGLVGKDVDAYATSYNCSNCHESIYAHIHPKEDETTLYPITEVISSSPVKTSSPTQDKQRRYVTVARVRVGIDSEPQAYIEDDRPYQQGDTVVGKKVVEAVRKVSRPPLDVLLERQSDSSPNLASIQSQLTKQADFETKAGAQAIFMCPFCDYVSDADIQAALWIALKGYLGTCEDKSEIAQQWKKVTSGSSKEKIRLMLDFAKEKKIQPISFDISKRSN